MIFNMSLQWKVIFTSNAIWKVLNFIALHYWLYWNIHNLINDNECFYRVVYQSREISSQALLWLKNKYPFDFEINMKMILSPMSTYGGKNQLPASIMNVPPRAMWTSPMWNNQKEKCTSSIKTGILVERMKPE